MGESWEVFWRFFPIRLFTEMKNPVFSNILFLERNAKGDVNWGVHFEKHHVFKK